MHHINCRRKDTRFQMGSSVPGLQHFQFLAVLLLWQFVNNLINQATITAAASSLLAFPEISTCVEHIHDGQRAFCEALAALESATPYTELNGNQGEFSSSRRRSRYKEEGGPSLHRYAAEPSLDLEILLRSYSRMHAACNILDRVHLSTKATTLQVQCKYLVWSCTFGLGNQLMSLVSAFLLAIISQRVLLLDNPAWDQLFSEPFDGSSWLGPPGLSFKDIEAPTIAEFQALRCDETRPGRLEDERCRTNVVSMVFSLASSMEDHQLLVCPSSILALRKVTFFNLRNSNQHFALGFYLNPALRPLLELLFPQRNVFHALSRFLLFPSDVVWDKILKYDPQVLNASRRIGVQLRESKGDYRHYFDVAVPLCIKSTSKLCPIEADEDQDRHAPPEEFVSVYVSCLVGGHLIQLHESIPRLEAETKQRYVLLSQPADGEQIDDIAHQQKALVDIWILSLSDILLTTHMSTFGYTAHALAGITPFHLKHWPDNPCQLSLSNDPCYHFAPKQVACPRDQFVLQDPLLEVSYIKACPDIAETGLQLQEEF